MTDPVGSGGWLQNLEDLIIRKQLRNINIELRCNTPCTLNVAFSDSGFAPLNERAIHCTTVLLYCGTAGMISLAGESPDGRVRVTSGGN